MRRIKWQALLVYCSPRDRLAFTSINDDRQMRRMTWRAQFTANHCSPRHKFAFISRQEDRQMWMMK